MFYKRWSSSVALPLGPQWGDPDNGKGGVAACMTWSRKDDLKRRPASASVVSRRPPPGPGPNKSSLKIAGKAFSFKPERDKQERTLDENEVVNAVHRASRQSVTRRPASASGAVSRSWRPFNPTPPPSQRKSYQNYMKRNDAKLRTESPEEVTGWTYKFREKNIYDLYDVDAFHSPSTPSRSNSAGGYMPSPDMIGYGERRSRNDYRSPQQDTQQVGNETEFTIQTRGSRATARVSPQRQIEKRGIMNNREIKNGDTQAPNEAKYDTLSKELDRAIQTIRDLTRFQKETLGLYQASNNNNNSTHPAYLTTYDREYNTKSKNDTTKTNGYHVYRPQATWEPPKQITQNGYQNGYQNGHQNGYQGYKPQPPPSRGEPRQKRDFVKENARPIMAPREAWNTTGVPVNNSKVHTLRGPNGLMTVRVDCGDKPVKNITVRVLDDKKTPLVTVDR